MCQCAKTRTCRIGKISHRSILILEILQITTAHFLSEIMEYDTKTRESTCSVPR